MSVAEADKPEESTEEPVSLSTKMKSVLHCRHSMFIQLSLFHPCLFLAGLNALCSAAM
jgi:hypothetical protein